MSEWSEQYKHPSSGIWESFEIVGSEAYKDA